MLPLSYTSKLENWVRRSAIGSLGLNYSTIYGLVGGIMKGFFGNYYRYINDIRHATGYKPALVTFVIFCTRTFGVKGNSGVLPGNFKGSTGVGFLTRSYIYFS